ncbi:MAG: hypothetical protein FWC72_01255 [Oscillospiraceae bacterium]|nr:hypothetical protein [Oscillospiraceae bacterium]
MTANELVIAISALGAAIAAQIESDEDLSFIAAATTQLGDTLATIAAWRAKYAADLAKAEADNEKKETEAGQ